MLSVSSVSTMNVRRGQVSCRAGTPLALITFAQLCSLHSWCVRALILYAVACARQCVRARACVLAFSRACVLVHFACLPARVCACVCLTCVCAFARFNYLIMVHRTSSSWSCRLSFVVEAAEAKPGADGT